MSTLIDGQPAASHQKVIGALDTLGLAHKTSKHEPMFTVEDAIRLREDDSGGHSKNLFLKNRKGCMWLVVMGESKRANLASLSKTLQSGSLSFASADRLMNYLGVTPGAVTPLAVMNDHQCKVTLIIERALLDYDILHFHPCTNDMTTSLSAEALLTFVTSWNHPPVIIDME